MDELNKALADQAGWWGAVIMIVAVGLAGVFDVIALFSDGKILSISEVLGYWSREYAIIPLAIGIVVGHLFFPRPR